MMPSSSRRYLVPAAASFAAAAAAWALLSRPSAAIHHGARRRKVVLITGGSRGLGLALAERFGRSGAKLVLTARDEEELKRARQTLLDREAIVSPDDILLHAADVTDVEQVGALIDHAIGHFGLVDILINNAGIIEVGPIENQPLETFEKAMRTNFFGALHMIQAVLPHMLARHRAGERRAGAIVNIASIGGKFAMPHLLPYVASKFALVGFSEGLHAELRGQGIRVTTVCPGLMRTGSHVQARFTGQKEKEYRWFAIGATTPGLAATASHAADRIYRATMAGQAEITITPQAWLAARAVGVAPALTQFAAAAVSTFLLPAPKLDDGEGWRASTGLELDRVKIAGTPSAESLREKSNQP